MNENENWSGVWRHLKNWLNCYLFGYSGDATFAALMFFYFLPYPLFNPNITKISSENKLEFAEI